MHVADIPTGYIFMGTMFAQAVITEWCPVLADKYRASFTLVSAAGVGIQAHFALGLDFWTVAGAAAAASSFSPAVKQHGPARVVKALPKRE